MTNIATITQKGQVTIPVEIRNTLGLESSNKLIFSVENEKIIAQAIKDDILSLYGSLKPKNKKPLSFQKIRKIARSRVAKKAAKEGL